MTVPTFLGIGVPRGGTTWLHTLLVGHPEVHMPSRRKEVRFFDRHYDRGLEWYETFFCPTEERERYRAIGEISPQYIYGEACPERIARTLPEAQLIVALRHPVDRAYSQYGFLVQRRNFRGSFEAFLADRPRALEMGFYSPYLRTFLRFFDRTRILALVFEEVFADIDRAQRRVADYLGIATDGFDTAAVGRRVNASTVPTFPRASGLAVTVGRGLRRSGLEGVADLGRRAGVQRVLSRGRGFPPLDAETRHSLSDVYAEDIAELERLLDLDLSTWRADRLAGSQGLE